jgi:hypothetical protein
MKHEVNIKQNLNPDTGWDSSDGIVILYGLNRPRTEFRTYPDQSWRPSTLLNNFYQVSAETNCIDRTSSHSSLHYKI